MGRKPYDDTRHLVKLVQLMDAGKASSVDAAAEQIAQSGEAEGASEEAIKQRLAGKYRKEPERWEKLARHRAETSGDYTDPAEVDGAGFVSARDYENFAKRLHSATETERIYLMIEFGALQKEIAQLYDTWISTIGMGQPVSYFLDLQAFEKVAEAYKQQSRLGPIFRGDPEKQAE